MNSEKPDGWVAYKDGLQDYCKLCQAEGNKKYVLANPDKRKRTIKNYCKAAGSKFYLKSKELRSVKIKALAALQVAMLEYPKEYRS